MEFISPDQLPRIAYFSMEIGLEPHIPTYSGGLGVLAGDTLRSAADLRLPMVGLTLVYRKGYFRQHLDAQGNQTESPASWTPEEILEPLETKVTVAWKEDQSSAGLALPGARPLRPYSTGIFP